MRTDGTSIASQPPEAALAALRSQAAGLSPGEARRRLQAFGPNRVETLAGEPVWLTLLLEFTHFFALVLWLAAGLAFAAEVMRSYVARAVEMLSEYDPSEYRTALVNLCAYIAERDR